LYRYWKGDVSQKKRRKNVNVPITHFSTSQGTVVQLADVMADSPVYYRVDKESSPVTVDNASPRDGAVTTDPTVVTAVMNLDATGATDAHIPL